MIVEAIVRLLFDLANGLFTWASNALPAAPAWIESLNDGIATVLGLIPEAVRWFVPLQPAAVVGVTLASLLLAAGLVRLVRRVVSLFTGGGGNA